MTGRRCFAGLSALAALAVAPVVSADEADEPGLIGGAAVAAAMATDPRDHHRQFGLALSLPFGLRAIQTWDGEYCGGTNEETGGNAPACVGRAPQALDVTVSYGVRPLIEAILELRVGLEGDVGPTSSSTDGPHVFHLAPGARLFYSDARTSKLFSTAQAVFDFTGHEDVTGESLGTDLGVRNVNGIWFDRDASWGWYLFFGETLSFTRWLRFELEGGAGIQGRLP